MIPGPTELKYLSEISKTENISRAAERLGVSQPTITMAIIRLEKQMGVVLLHRFKNGVALTVAGKRVVASINQLQDYWRQVLKSAKSSQYEVTGLFRLGCHVSVGLYTLHHFLPQLMKQYPFVYMDG